MVKHGEGNPVQVCLVGFDDRPECIGIPSEHMCYRFLVPDVLLPLSLSIDE
jgi:hypothetical protein